MISSAEEAELPSKDLRAKYSSKTKMFSKKRNFWHPGDLMRKVNPINLPLTSAGGKKMSRNSGHGVDVSLLDFMSIEEFLAILKAKTSDNNQALWKASCSLAYQLKGSRALLSLGSFLSSNEGSRNLFDRLIDTAQFVLNSDQIYLFELDPDDSDMFILSHTHTEATLGAKLRVDCLVPGNFFCCRVSSNLIISPMNNTNNIHDPMNYSQYRFQLRMGHLRRPF
jgi:hypothetical protein